ncbi:RNA polymerase sigma factor [Acutalibacter sp. 1XD8-36]|nr:RNA polymerase sigma factor [Acutalibacter sp. 1XD8-36]
MRGLSRRGNPVEDMRIIELFKRRDELAISETRRKYGPYCNKIALNLLGSIEDAEECVSDALFAAWRQIPPLIPRSLRAFLGRVTRNLSVSRYRSGRASKRSCGMDSMLSELADCLPDGSSIDDQVDSRALTGIITRWLDGLPPRDKELFVRRYWFCDSLGEIAAEMEEAPGALAQRTYQLRKSLKNCLEKEGYTI